MAGPARTPEPRRRTGASAPHRGSRALACLARLRLDHSAETCHSGGPIADAQLGVDVLEVLANGARREPEELRDPQRWSCHARPTPAPPALDPSAARPAPR